MSHLYNIKIRSSKVNIELVRETTLTRQACTPLSRGAQQRVAGRGLRDARTHESCPHSTNTELSPPFLCPCIPGSVTKPPHNLQRNCPARPWRYHSQCFPPPGYRNICGKPLPGQGDGSQRTHACTQCALSVRDPLDREQRALFMRG